MNIVVYAYAVLRYVHDQNTGEFANVGVVVRCESADFLGVKMRDRWQRLTSFFPGARARALQSVSSAIVSALRKANSSYSPDIERSVGSAEREVDGLNQIMRIALPRDDSALQWSEIFTGITTNVAKELDRLFRLLVSGYDVAKPNKSRSDSQIWSTFSRVLDNRHLASLVQEHKIRTKHMDLEFKKSIKNGKWHILEPISFDLATSDTIREKALKVSGLLTQLSESGRKDFVVHLLVGEPASPKLKDAYQSALGMIGDFKKLDMNIFPESDLEGFDREIEKIAQSALEHV